MRSIFTLPEKAVFHDLICETFCIHIHILLTYELREILGQLLSDLFRVIYPMRYEVQSPPLLHSKRQCMLKLVYDDLVCVKTETELY